MASTTWSWSWLPRGRPLPPEEWAARHPWVVGVLAAQVVGLVAFGAWRDYGLTHSLADAVPAIGLAAIACVPRLGPLVRSTAAAMGLMAVSTSLVHLSGGYIESHFHFFVMIPIVAVYQQWLPFGLSIGLVLVHHGVMGTLDPTSIYNHPAGQAQPWLWAGIHAGAIAAACVGTVVAWGLHERSREAVTRLADELAHRADHDSLTGLPARQVFLDRTEQAVLLAARTGVQPSVLMIDMDGFKEVNDTFGHHAGDLVLVEAARRLRGCVRVEDTVTRLGGDEFAVLVVGGDDDAGCSTAQRVVSALGRPYELEGHRLDLEASVGVATARPGTEVPSLVRQADAAMYLAKEQRSGWARHHGGADDAGSGTRIGLLGELRRALEQDELLLVFQPKIDLGSDAVGSVEALVRWQHPERGLLPPSEFLSVVERTSLSQEFTDRVLHLALDQVASWRAEGLDLAVAVNISARCLSDDQLTGRVVAALESSGVPPDRLCLEITENVLVEDPEAAAVTLGGLRRLGVKVSLDDFGTGYASMSYLRSLPLDELKVDRSFVSGLGSDPEHDVVLVRSVVELAHQFGLPVVAEGVEDEHTHALLRRLGCDTAQGFHLARPMPGGEVAGWLRDREAHLRGGGQTSVVAAVVGP